MFFAVETHNPHLEACKLKINELNLMVDVNLVKGELYGTTNPQLVLIGFEDFFRGKLSFWHIDRCLVFKVAILSLGTHKKS